MRRVNGSITEVEKLSSRQSRWLVRSTVDGKRIGKRITGTRKEAEAALVELNATDVPGDTTLDTFFNGSFIPACRKKGLADSTIHGYTNVYETHIKKRLGDCPIESVKPAQVQQLLSGLTYGSARHVKAVLSSVFSQAECIETVQQSVMRRKYILPSKENATGKARGKGVMDYDTLCSVADDCQGEVFEPMFLLMAFCGMRRSEAAGVQLRDINFTERNGETWAIIDLSRTVQYFDHSVHVSDNMKTDASRRSCVMMPPHAQRLRELVLEATSCGQTWLTEADGKVANPDNISCAWDRWFRDAPYARIPFSNLRNSYTTNMIEKGYDLGMVSQMTGHSEIGTTYKHYLRPAATDIMEYLSE